MRLVVVMLLTAFFFPVRAHAFFGSEMIPLMKLVAGQVVEIERLTENLNLAKDQVQTLRELNDGINRTVSQIEDIEAIMTRVQNLDPKAIRSLADLNDLLERAQATKGEIESLMHAQVLLADQVIATSALQSDTAYKMGQEMVVVGSELSAESKTASPGRAGQITAGASSAQMLASGVQLQTLAQIVQLQAMNLEFQKNQAQQSLRESQIRRSFYERQLSGQARGVRKENAS